MRIKIQRREEEKIKMRILIPAKTIAEHK